MKKKILWWLIGVVYVIVVTGLVWRWAAYAAYMERGYKAIGGEYLLVIVIFSLAVMAVRDLIKAAEEVQRDGENEETE